VDRGSDAQQLYALEKMVSGFPPGYVFSFFAGMMVLQLIWVKTLVPETKGVPLEQIQKQLGIK
jgi:SP family arabinose:H+ symporter-like MFS transporter